VVRLKYQEIIKLWLPNYLYELIRELYSYVVFLGKRDLVRSNITLEKAQQGASFYIVGSGPSLAKQNLLLLRGKNLIFLNNCYVMEEYRVLVSNSPSAYHLVAPIHKPQSDEEWLDWLLDMESKIPSTVIMVFGLNARKTTIETLCKDNGLFQKHRKIWFFASKNFSKEEQEPTKYCSFTAPIMIGGTASVYALLFLEFVGASKAYLLGMDHDYFLHEKQEDMRIYKSALHQNNEISRTYQDRFYVDEYLRQYKIFCKYFYIEKYLNVKVYNSSAGGVLKIFDRISLENSLVD
jgi:hypothetical protein